jgi:hypothetical protein
MGSSDPPFFTTFFGGGQGFVADGEFGVGVSVPAVWLAGEECASSEGFAGSELDADERLPPPGGFSAAGESEQSGTVFLACVRCLAGGAVFGVCDGDGEAGAGFALCAGGA